MNKKKIINIIEVWDRAIELKEKLLEEKLKQKKGLVERLLYGKIRLNGFDDKWEKTEISGKFLKLEMKKVK